MRQLHKRMASTFRKLKLQYDGYGEVYMIQARLEMLDNYFSNAVSNN